MIMYSFNWECKYNRFLCFVIFILINKFTVKEGFDQERRLITTKKRKKPQEKRMFFFLTPFFCLFCMNES